MVEFDIAEDVQPSRKRQILASVIANIGTLTVGVVMGYTAFAFPKLESSKDFKEITLNEKAWIASAAPLGIVLSHFFTEICQEKLGRRKTILLMAIPLNLAWIIIVCASDVGLMCLGRFITGLTAGSFLTVVPLYVNEISHESLHKYLESLHYCMIPLGVIISYATGYLLDWLWLSMLCSITPILLICGMVHMPESPYFLISQGKTEKAASSLKWLGVSDDCYEIKLMITEIQRSLEETNSKRQNISWKEYISGEKIKATIACIVFNIVQQFSLMNIIIFFSVDIFTDISFSNINSDLFAILMSFMLFVSVTLSSLLHGFKSHCKIILCVSTVGSSVALGILGTLWLLKALLDPMLFTYIYLGILIIYTILYGMGLGYLPYVFSRKCLPGLHYGLAFICTWVSAFTITLTYFDLSNLLGTGILCIALAVIGLFSLPFVYILPKLPSEEFANET